MIRARGRVGNGKMGVIVRREPGRRIAQAAPGQGLPVRLGLRKPPVTGRSRRGGRGLTRRVTAGRICSDTVF